MRLVGALAAGIFLFFGIGMLTGRVPNLRVGLGKSRDKPDVTTRQVWLTQAGLDLSPVQYYGGLSVVALAAFALVSAMTTTPAVALAPAVAAVVVPHMYFAKRRSANMAQTAAAWPDAIRELVAAIESNASLHGALVQLSYSGPAALRPAFERFPTLAATVGTVPALESVRERLSDPTSDRVIEVMILAHERGGGIVTDILRDLASATTEDLQLLEDIRTQQLEQKINGRAVFVIPWLVLMVLVSSDENFREFYQSASGYVVVLAGAIASILGMVLLSALSRDKSEPRVFGGSATRARTRLDDDDIDDDGDGGGGGGGGDDPQPDPPSPQGEILRPSTRARRYDEADLDESKLIPVTPTSTSSSSSANSSPRSTFRSRGGAHFSQKGGQP